MQLARPRSPTHTGPRAGWLSAVLGADLAIEAIWEPCADEETATTHPHFADTRWMAVPPGGTLRLSWPLTPDVLTGTGNPATGYDHGQRGTELLALCRSRRAQGTGVRRP
jgi:hypothetical protein